MAEHICAHRNCDRSFHANPAREKRCKHGRFFCCAEHRRAEEEAVKADHIARIAKLRAAGMDRKQIAETIGLHPVYVHKLETEAQARKPTLADRSRLMSRPPARIAARLAQLPECERRFVEWDAS